MTRQPSPASDVSRPGANRHALMRICVMAALLVLLAACGSQPVRQHGTSGAPASHTRPAPADKPSAGLEEISIQAISLVGIPYRTGGNTPDTGFDCSGFVRYVVNRSTGVLLPRTTAGMSTAGQELGRHQLAPGDLVFFNTQGPTFSHVGIYVGHNRFVHAPSTGGTVRLEDMSRNYWANRYTGARRVTGSGIDLATKP